MKRILLVLAMLVAFISMAIAQNNPASWVSSVKKIDQRNYTIELRASITPPWHLYDMGPYVDGPNATQIIFTPSDDYSLVGDVTTSPEPKRVYDNVFEMEIGYFENAVTFSQNVQLSEGANGAAIEALVEWMCCNESSCTPPSEQEFSIVIGELAEDVASAQQSAISNEISVDPLHTRPLMSNILEAIMWGLAALLTPCVFPMIPMTVSFFIKKTGSRAKVSAILFGLSIVALYTLPITIIIATTRFIGGDAITIDILKFLATHWIPNLIFFVVFMIFAMSFFGAFEMVLPSSIVNKSDSKADKGGVVGILFMAVTLVLVSFSCTGPIVGSVLISSTSGAVWTPVITMVAFSTAFALPFTLFALFPTLLTKLPKSGGWLSSVKVVLGFVELALGLKFLSIADQTYHWGILDREVFLALWIVIFSLMGFYLLGKIRFAHQKVNDFLSVPRLMLSIIVFSFVVYMIPGMWGAPLKGLSGYLPPISTQDFVSLSTTSPQVINSSAQNDMYVDGKPKYSDDLTLPHGLQGFFTLDEAIAYSKKVNKPIFASYTGHGCVNCREMEARVWSDPKVLKLLKEDFVVVALYSDDKQHMEEEDWVVTASGRTIKSLGKANVYLAHTRYGVNSQPYYMILDSDGDQIVKGRGYNTSIKGFIGFLDSGIEAYNNQK
ncbi:MAG: cytochrome c biogenesis protein CcdA [Rikenellaceae bacterium]